MLLADEIHTKKRIPAMMVLAVWAVLMTGLFFGIATLNVTLGFLAAGLAAFVVIALMARALTRK
jgi:asparagine N-glycosylation enzyme membrane subunit Stt3